MRCDSYKGRCLSEPARPKRVAFTLIELLVVFAIIGILAAILLPVLAQAKARAWRAQCINNEKQLMLTWVVYSGDNNGRLVSNSWCPRGGDPNTKLWVQGSFFYPDTNDALIYSPDYALFAPHLASSKVYHCPADVLDFSRNGVQGPKLRSYELNAFMGWTGAWIDLCPPGACLIFEKDTQITAPSRFFTFIDVYPQSICWPYFGVRMEDTGNENFCNYPAIAHNNGAVVSFADGHVEWHRWSDPRTLAPASMDFHLHDDPSSGNADVDWLEEHATIVEGSLQFTLPPGGPSGPM